MFEDDKNEDKNHYEEELDYYNNYEEENYRNVQYSNKVDDQPKEAKFKRKEKRKFRGSFVSYVIVIIIASMIGGLSSFYLGAKLLPQEVASKGNSLSDTVNINTNDDINTVSAVVKKSIDSVVGITTVGVQQDWIFLREVEGVGSGVIVDPNGFILTNSHVISGGTKSITVLLGSGEKLPAKVVWDDPALDLAMVKVDATNLPAAKLGDSDALQVGEISVAIGNPLGLEFQSSVTSGIISGLNRSVRVSETSVIENLIQTDASINPGNSGGPLLNSKGDVIGINTAKIKTAEGLGFSIPINDIKPIIEEVISNGNFKTVFLGVSVRTVEDYQRILGVKLPVDKGLILTQVVENSPAARAGLSIGDIIMKIDDNDLDSFEHLKRVLYKYKQGDKAVLTVMRANEELKIDIEFTELQE